MDRRTALLNTAEQLFTKHGARRVTIQEICHQAGISKMTFYKHFRNKTDLVRQMHDELVERGFAKYDEINRMEIPFAEKISLMGKWKQEFMARLNVGFYKELIDVEHSVEEYRRRYLKNIEDAQKNGDVRDDVDPEFLWLMLEKLGELFAEKSALKVCGDLGEAQRQLRTVIWYGLLTREGGAP